MLIKIDHIAKIEGHAGFVAEIAEGKVQKVRLDILEGARLLEGILRGRSIFEASQITSRICGVCPVVHNLTSLKALENALGIEVSEQTVLLRKLLMLGQIINSHALHLFFFSLSDFFGVKNDLNLVKKFPQKTQEGLALREFGNQIIEVIGGRSIHPLTPEIGGFTKLPDEKKLHHLWAKTDEILAKAISLARLFAQLKYPDFQRPASFIGLHHAAEYAFYDGQIKTPAEEKETVKEFMKIVKEFQLKGSAVKQSHYLGKPFMVGAISRINHNAGQLNPQAKKILKSGSLRLPTFNPFYNILAQAIEIVHCVEESEKLLHQILRRSLKPENHDFKPQAGEGWGAIEAPRGTLYYYYAVTPDGLIKDCNIITPTSQNLARLEEDLKEYLPELAGKNTPKKEMEAKIKMLVRAYDPCLTCAIH